MLLVQCPHTFSLPHLSCFLLCWKNTIIFHSDTVQQHRISIPLCVRNQSGDINYLVTIFLLFSVHIHTHLLPWYHLHWVPVATFCIHLSGDINFITTVYFLCSDYKYSPFKNEYEHISWQRIFSVMSLFDQV